MLRITKAEDQALRLVMQLAATGGQLTLGQLAERERLPEPTVAKLLGMLRRGGVVTAIRGRHGGYELAARPVDISAARVLRALGAEPAPSQPCVSAPRGSGECPRLDDCGLRAVWRHLHEQVAGVLEKTTIADLLHVEETVDGRLEQIWPRDDEGRPISGVGNAVSEGA